MEPLIITLVIVLGLAALALIIYFTVIRPKRNQSSATAATSTSTPPARKPASDAEEWLERYDAAESDEEHLALGPIPNDPSGEFADQLEEARQYIDEVNERVEQEKREKEEGTARDQAELATIKATTDPEQQLTLIRAYFDSDGESYLEQDDITWLEERETELKEQATAKRLAAIKSTEDETTQFRLITELYDDDEANEFLSDEDWAWLDERDAELKENAPLRLFKAAQGGDGQSFAVLLKMKRDREWPNSVDMPEDWNEQLMWFTPVPTIEDFANLTDDWSAGALPYAAAAALKQRDLTLAGVVLAYCNSDSDFAEEVGDVLCAELVKFVVEARPHLLPDYGAELIKTSEEVDEDESN